MNPQNILFVLLDDMGWRDLGCYGSSFYETPNNNKLTEDGMSFKMLMPLALSLLPHEPAF